MFQGSTIASELVRRARDMKQLLQSAMNFPNRVREVCERM